MLKQAAGPAHGHLLMCAPQRGEGIEVADDEGAVKAYLLRAFPFRMQESGEDKHGKYGDNGGEEKAGHDVSNNLAREEVNHKWRCSADSAVELEDLAGNMGERIEKYDEPGSVFGSVELPECVGAACGLNLCCS